MREILQDTDLETNERLNPPRVLGWLEKAKPEVAQVVIDAAPNTGDGRSDWHWFRLANGDLMLATFPQGETYFATEADEARP